MLKLTTTALIQCETCGIEFSISKTRLERNKHHTCSKKCLGVLSSKLYSTKIKTPCVVCKTEISYKPSHYREIKYHTCSSQCRSILLKTVYRGNNNPRSLKLNEEERWFWERSKDYERRSKLKEIPFDLDYKFLIELFYNQKGLCHYSGIRMKQFSDSNRKNAAASFDVASLDRINSEGGYTKDNVVWCLNSINMFKAHHKLEDIKTVMKGIIMTEAKVAPLKFKKLSEKAATPKYTRVGDSGLDLVATSLTVDTSNGSIIYGTGIAVEIPKGFTGLLVPRSSVVKTSLMLYNSIGIIDSNFRGEIKVIFKNTGSSWYKVGDRVAQLVLVPTPEFEPTEVSELDETERGSSGFGSSGA